MQISKTFLVVCTVAYCASSFSLAADDSPLQAQAREALRKKMAELDAQGAAIETPSPKQPKAKQKPVSAPEPRPVVQELPATTTPAPPPVVAAPPSTASVTTMSSEQAARLREALRQKMAELEAEEKARQPVAAATVAPVVTPADRKSAAEVIKAEQEAAATEQKRLTAEAETKTKKPKRDKAMPVAATAAQSALFAPIEPPPSAVPTSKEAKLTDLLRKYKADEITPEEYHKQRANILAEP